MTLGDSPCEHCLCLTGDTEAWTDRLSERREKREAEEIGGGLKGMDVKEHAIELWREALHLQFTYS